VAILEPSSHIQFTKLSTHRFCHLLPAPSWFYPTMATTSAIVESVTLPNTVQIDGALMDMVDFICRIPLVLRLSLLSTLVSLDRDFHSTL
jgi:hypothetical protein